MPTIYPTEGYLILTGVSFSGTAFSAGSSISWTALGANDDNFRIVDDDDDGRLDAQSDYLNENGPAATFTGYTATSGGTEYPIFTDSFSNYAILLPQDGSTQTLFATGPGTSNLYQAETSDTDVYLCFGPGTLIATPDGEVAVETLQIGDLVSTADGHNAPVKWIGRQTLRKLLSGLRMQPVRICVGALGGGLPRSDLTVTADHGMIIDGLVINASALVNGHSIDWVPMAELPDVVTYYHIETESHDVILAEGAPTETYLDIPGRMAFDNFQEYLDLYGSEQRIPELDCPRISSQRLVPDEIRARLGIAAESVEFGAVLLSA